MRQSHLGLANGGREFTGAAEHRPAAVTNVVPPTTGADGTRGGAIDLVGSESAKSGIYALLDVDLFNLLLIPETFDMTAGQEAGVIPPAIASVELRRAFYIVDAPSNRTLPTSAPGPTTVAVAQRRNLFPRGSHRRPARRTAAAADGAFGHAGGRLRAHRRHPRSLEGAGRHRCHAQRRARPGAARSTTSRTARSIRLGVNVLRSFPAYGRVSWGARTMRGADAQADEYKYIPIRRLALFLEESLYRGTQWVVFEPNDEPLWAQIRLNIGAFMNGLVPPGRVPGQDAGKRRSMSSATRKRRRRPIAISASSTSRSALRR